MKQAVKQPVFKPLTNTENTSLFNFETQVSKVRTSATPFLKPHGDNQATAVDNRVGQETGTERLSSLHAKLHQEADKIRKWKVQTEIELRQKDKKIQEATSTNECLRKSILELQLQMENLSLKLQDEIGNREEIMERINSTRQLCTILKEHAVKLQEKVQQCETERTELKYMEKEHLQQFEDLSAQFKKMELTSVEEHNKLVVRLQHEIDDRRLLEEQMESKLDEAEVQLKTLMDQCDDKDIKIQDGWAMLERNDEKIHNLEQINATIQEKSAKLTEEIISKDAQILSTTEQLQLVQNEKLELEVKLAKMTDDLNILQKKKNQMEEDVELSNTEFCQQLEGLKKQIDELNSNLLSATERVRVYEQQLSEMSILSENLKSSRDILTLENTKLEGSVSSLNKDINDCMTKYEEQLHINSALNEEVALLSSNLEESRTYILELQKLVDHEKENSRHKSEEIKCLQEKILNIETTMCEKQEDLLKIQAHCDSLDHQLQAIQQECNRLQETLEDERVKVAESVRSKEDLQAELASKGKEVHAKGNEFLKLKKENEKLQKDIKKSKDEKDSLKENMSRIKGEYEELTIANEELQRIIDEIKEEKEEQDKSLDVEIKFKSKQVSDMEGKYKELKGDLSAKNKQIKESEKEIKGLKCKLSSQVKLTEARSKDCQESEEQINRLQTEVEEIQSVVQLLNEKLHAIKLSEKQAVKRMDEMTKKQEKAQKEKKDTEDKCDFQLGEMMATMEKYKQENNKIVRQKEKELEFFKSQTENFDSFKQQKNGQCEAIIQENEELKAALVKETNEKNRLLKKLTEKDNSVVNLEDDVRKKDMEMVSLQDSLKALELTVKRKLTSDLYTQTDASITLFPDGTLCKNNPLTPVTPKMDGSPQNYLKTPQRSILRSTNSVSKRRKVVFAARGDSGRNSASDSDSSSDLMEVELESMESGYKSRSKNTPLVIRPSPRIQPSPHAKIPDKKTEIAQKTPLVRVPRGPPVNLDKGKKESMKPVSAIREEKCRELFPMKSKDVMNRDKENIHRHKLPDQESSHVRKTPSKTCPKPTSKFFKASPKERYGKTAKQPTKEEIAWFDIDSVFGFGPED